MKVDYLIVGSGLTGAVIARILSDVGQNVLVLDRRDHLGGNVFDHFHPSGIRIHTYGPHYFRTSSDRIWKFVNSFSDFYEYRASLQTIVDNNLENWPILKSYIAKNIGLDWKPSFTKTPTNFEEACLSMMPKEIYQKFIAGYSEKQWGVPPSQLDAALASRFEVNEDDKPLLKYHKYQGIPVNGYATFMKNILDKIPVITNFDYTKNRSAIDFSKKLVFTGPIDEYYNYCFGKLKYRGQKREHIYYENINQIQPCGQLNNPQLHSGPHIRTLEWKHMMEPRFAKKITGTVLTTETTYTPENSEDYEYPFPDKENQNLYLKYKELAEAEDNTIICGRLGEYKYYDMDQAIGRAMMLAKKILMEISIKNASTNIDKVVSTLEQVGESDFAK